MDRANKFQDGLNARVCEIIAKCAGNSDCKLSDFLLLKREDPDTERIDTPENMQEKLKMLTMSLGGRVINRG